MKIQPGFKLSLLAAALGLYASQGLAAIACGSATATSVVANTPASGPLDQTGTITVNCTRAPGDPLTQVIYIGINQGEDPVAGGTREMTRQSGAQRMNYAIYRNATPSGAWSSGNGRAPGNAAGGGLQVTITFSSAATTAQSFPFNYYFRVTQANYTGAARPAGIYDDVGLVATVRLTNSTGAIQSTAAFSTTISKPSHCYFSTSPSNVAISYTALSNTAQTGSTSFGVSCTAGTTYTLSLDATSAVVLGLRYTLALTPAGAGGTQTGTAFPQNFGVQATFPAGQAGSCAIGNCTASQGRSITITY